MKPMTPTQLKDHRLFGSFAAVGRAAGVSREAARHWKNIPAERCQRLEAFTGGEITRYRMRPDVFGRAPAVLKKTG